MTLKIENRQKETVEFSSLSKGMLFEFNGELHLSVSVPSAPLNAVILKNFKAVRVAANEQVTPKFGELIVRS